MLSEMSDLGQIYARYLLSRVWQIATHLLVSEFGFLPSSCFKTVFFKRVHSIERAQVWASPLVLADVTALCQGFQGSNHGESSWFSDRFSLYKAFPQSLQQKDFFNQKADNCLYKARSTSRHFYLQVQGFTNIFLQKPSYTKILDASNFYIMISNK